MLKMKAAGEIGVRQKNRHGTEKKEVRTFTYLCGKILRNV